MQPPDGNIFLPPAYTLFYDSLDFFELPVDFLELSLGVSDFVLTDSFFSDVSFEEDSDSPPPFPFRA
jgi:hypothetical protein